MAIAVSADTRTAQNYSKTSLPVLRVDAQFTVVDAALKGYIKWRANHGAKPQEDVSRKHNYCYKIHTESSQEQERVAIEAQLESWCSRLLETQHEVSHVECVHTALILIVTGSSDTKTNSSVSRGILDNGTG